MASHEFFDRARAVAKRFLQSAVVVDDLARLGDEPIAPLEVPRPGRREKLEATTPRTPRREATHDLNAKALVDAFADVGIVCAVLRPKLEKSSGETKPEDTLKSIRVRTHLATQRSDIVILDWNIPPEERPGKTALSLVRNILKTDSSGEEDNAPPTRRIRLIAIYTGDEDLEEIAEQLRKLAGTLGLPQPTRNGCIVRAGPVVFVVYGKAGGTIKASTDRRVDEQALPGRLIDDFTAMTAGLLSNAAVAGLGIIRDNTHRIISRFSPRLDPSYVAHRAMLEPPEEAAEHPVPLLAAEIEGVLADSEEIPELVGEDALSEWLAAINGFEPGRGLDMEPDAFKEQLLGILRDGLRPADHQHAKMRELVERLREDQDRKAIGVLSRELCAPEVTQDDADLEFAILTSVRTQYDRPIPFLRLGTVVAFEKEGATDYRLCVQPLCHSVRVTGKRSFPFLRLREAAEGRPFEIVVRDDSDYKRLRPILRFYDVDFVTCKGDKQRRVVLASEQKSGLYFKIFDGEGLKVRWVADLKTDFAQRILNRFAADVARVGLTESEWLRRMAKDFASVRP